MTPSRGPGAPRSIEQVLAQARGRLARLDPDAALGAQRRGALLVDIRPEANRRAEGEIPGSLILERIVLEWRLDPASDARLSHASYQLRVVVVCNEGFASSLAAAALLDLGVTRATDLIGGYRAWRACGLPIVTGGTPAGELVAGRGWR